MGKKMEEAEVKKECPSCGLGVALDSTVCEFCGWDFEEEDEWILQIEKLERDLMLEKQKFEPGSVNEKIESTLHTPSLERIEQIRARQEQGVPATPQVERAAPTPAAKPAQPAPAASQPARVGEQKGMREARPAEMDVTPSPQPRQEVRVEAPRPAAAAPAIPRPPETTPKPPAGKVRRVRTVKALRADTAEQSDSSDDEKTRLVRKTK